MNRSRRQPYNKQFVPGGVYDSPKSFAPQRQQQPPQQQQQPRQIVQQQQQQQRQQTPQTPQQQQQQPRQQTPQQQQQPRQQTPQQQQPRQQIPKQQQQWSKASEEVQQQQDSEPEPSQPVEASATVEQPAATPAVEESLVDESGKPQFKKIFVARKKSSVRAKEKKIRQNRQLRKAIFPKNALMALNEVKGVNISDSSINSNTDGSGGYTAIVTVNEKQYEGKGSSKISAKNSACEKALRDYVLEKMRQRPRIPRTSISTSEAGEPMEETANEPDEETVDGQKTGEEPADDVPMINLASFAIYKLFAEWESEGYDVPELHPCASNGQSNGSENGDAAAAAAPRKPTIRTELPANWEAMHPATLLCMMRPGLTYTVCGTLGDRPNIIQRVSATVDGEEFIGTGRSKKAARRSVAVAACNKLFGTNFVTEEAMEQ